MKAAVKLDQRELDILAKAMKKAPETVQLVLKGTLQKALFLFEREAKERTPFSSTKASGLRGSIISTAPRISGERITGETGSPLPHALPVELGSKPHMPPVLPLKEWVETKLHVAPSRSLGVAWAVARKIAAKGTEGAHMFEQAKEVVTPKFKRFLENATQEVATTLEIKS